MLGGEAVLRFGKFNRVAGPGLVFTWPIIGFYTLRIDQRVATSHVLRRRGDAHERPRYPSTWTPCCSGWCSAPRKACVEVEDYSAAVAWWPQTAMRKAIGAPPWPRWPCDAISWALELKDAHRGEAQPLGYRHHRRGGLRHRRSEGVTGSHGHGGAVAEPRNARMVLAEAGEGHLRDAEGRLRGCTPAIRTP